jgi:hypothetical protein
MIDHKQMRYVHGISRKPLPEGRVLVHNHVITQPRIGMNGFCQRRRQNVPNGGEILYQSG